MMLKPFHVKSDDGKTFYSDTRADLAARCNDTEPVAPIGDDLAEMTRQRDLAVSELRNIVDADIRNFGAIDPNHEFRLWAQSRARHTLAAMVEPIGDDARDAARYRIAREAIRWQLSRDRVFSTAEVDAHYDARIAAVAAQGESGHG